MRNIVKVATVLAAAVVAPIMTVGAQQIAPAAVVRPAAAYVRPAPAPTDSIRPLSFHMKRGGAYGAVTGVVLTGLAVLAIKESEDKTADGFTPLTGRQGLGIVAIGTATGLAVGSFLGLTYHFQLVETRQRATAGRQP